MTRKLNHLNCNATEMRRRLDQSRLFEKDFQLVELLSSETRQTEFFDEIFNHTLRMSGSSA